MANIVREPCDEGVIHSGPPCPPVPSHVGMWVLLATILGSSIAFIDASAVNLALPALQRDLKATVADAQWVVEAYSLFLAALILVGGALGDRFGRRRIFMLGVALFSVASAGSGLAQNVPELIGWRAIQGVGGALLTPGSLAIISGTFSGEARGKAIGTWSAFSAVTGVIGPVLGGILIQYASWRWVFFINLPLAAIVLAVSWWRVPETRDEEDAGKRVDFAGAALATVALGTIVYALIRSQTFGLGDPQVLATLAVGTVALVAFVLVERRAEMPMMPLGLFRSPVLSGTNVLTLLLYAGLAGSFFFLPLNLIEVQRYSTATAGVALLPAIVVLSVLSRRMGGIVARTGARLPLTIGPAIAGLGFLLLAITGVGRPYWISFLPASLVLGLGMAITVAPLTASVLGAVPVSHAGVASGINNAVARTAGLLAIAVFSVLFVAQFDAGLTSRMVAHAVPAQARQFMQAEKSKLAAAQIPARFSPSVQATIRGDLDNAFVDAFRTTMLFAFALAIAGAVTSWLVIPRQPAKEATSAEPAPQPVAAQA